MILVWLLEMRLVLRFDSMSLSAIMGKKVPG